MGSNTVQTPISLAIVVKCLVLIFFVVVVNHCCNFSFSLFSPHILTIKNTLNLLKFVHPELSTSQSSIKKCLLIDDAASASILASRKNCKELNTLLRLSSYLATYVY